MTGSPRVMVKLSAATSAVSENALADIFWHPVQWQAVVMIGADWISNLSWPQRQLPVVGDMVYLQEVCRLVQGLTCRARRVLAA